MAALALALLCVTIQWGIVQGQNASLPSYSVLPESVARPAPAYMVDNTRNFYHVAPDKGNQNGPVWRYSGSLKNYMANLANDKVIRGAIAGTNSTITTPVRITAGTLDLSPGANVGNATKRATSSDYWLTTLAPLGSQPLAGTGYQFYRDVTTFGADPTGSSDSAESINAAVSSWNQTSAGGGQTRCGETCGNSFTEGAIVYFPPGTYKICSPVIQYYYTQFIGDANNPPTIKGCDTFQGIALFDTDPYIPGGSGSEWYINQNQFFRQIRNFIFDLTDMPDATDDDDQPLVPTGIHWQVAQATSLQNLVFNMPVNTGSSSQSSTTAVGIFMENGSGGFVSDLTFNGGNIGWRAGSQQYTARNLDFKNCVTSVQMVWDWGFNWQGITIDGGSIGFNISGVGGVGYQGIGSISLFDSSINDVSVGILTNNLGTSPNIVLDNTVFTNVATSVQLSNGGMVLTGSPSLWATGAQYRGGTGSNRTGPVIAPIAAPSLRAPNGAIYSRSRPQYQTTSPGGFLVATTDGGCKNDGTGDQTGCLNAFLQKALAADQIAYFPAGIYRVGGTVLIPTGSVVQGSSWSQIQGAGYYFSDISNPRVMVQVGNPGEIGKMEIVEMLFSVQGNTAGAVLMEWNTAAGTQGEAAMWDSHFRVGGALGTDLDLSACPKNSINDQCIAASLMFHVTAQASGYFENVWAWVADHDNDVSLYNVPDSSSTQLTVFGARGMLIESQGPSWFVGTSSEHSVLYNYQVSGANDIYMGHIQTESPYFQPLPAAPAPFGSNAASFPNDPDFSQCPSVSNEEYNLCNYAWGLRVVDSSNIYIQSAGLYSFFNDFYQDCVGTNNCQERILEVLGSTDVVVFNLFTVAIVEPANGINNTFLSQSILQRGFTTETSVWIPEPGSDVTDIVYVGPAVFSSPTISCPSTCLLVFPTSPLSTPSTISIGNYTTSFEYGSLTTTTTNNAPAVIFVTFTTTVTIPVPPLTISGLSFSNVNITSSGPTPITIYPSVNVPPVTLELPNGSGSTTPRVITLPPWPLISAGPSGSNVITDPETVPPGTVGGSTTYFTPVVTTISAKSAGVVTLTFPPTASISSISCPATTAFTFATPAITVITTCTASTTLTYGFACPTTKVFTFLAATTGVVSVDCTFATLWSSGADRSSTTAPLFVYTTYPLIGTITPVTTTVPAPVVTGGGVNVPCKAWFFFICISTPNIHIGGIRWLLPPGIYPPGPPPLSIIDLPAGFTIEGNLPPWPKITIGNNGQITTESEPKCQTQSASICSFTTSYKVSGTKTTSTAVSSVCETITGCSISGYDYSTTAIATDGTQTLAPVGTEYDEDWAAATQDAAFSSSVFAAFSASLSLARATGNGTVVSFTTGPTPSPTCASGTGCGGQVCSGYYCSPQRTGYPPGYQAPNDPNSGGYSAATTSIKPSPTTTAPTTQTSSSLPPTITPPPPPLNVLEAFQFYLEEIVPGAGVEGYWGWEILNIPSSVTLYNPCAQTSIYVTLSPASSSDPSFTTTLGTFTLPNHGVCSYSGASATVGSIYCEDRYDAPCTAYPSSVRSSAFSCEDGTGARPTLNLFQEFYCRYS